MNRFAVLVLVLSGCMIGHQATAPDADDSDGGNGGDTVLVLVDGTPSDGSNEAGEDAAPIDPDATADASDAISVEDTGTDATPIKDVLALEDTGTDAGTETATDATPDSNPCTGQTAYCGGVCVRPQTTPSHCGTSCSFQTCGTGDICGFNLQDQVGCCQNIGAFPIDVVVGPPHCPPDVCPGGQCYASSAGPDAEHLWVYCCPPVT